MVIETVMVTDSMRAAALRVAMQNKSVIDVVDADGDTRRGRVLTVVSEGDTAQRWIVVLEVAA